ncbi:hypothetical protein HLV35_07445 [Eggerthellaceae bacterium zg-997]|nr:hypothetical protein [Eggerthellaceae bacterium zg-997]
MRRDPEAEAKVSLLNRRLDAAEGELDAAMREVRAALAGRHSNWDLLDELAGDAVYGNDLSLAHIAVLADDPDALRALVARARAWVEACDGHEAELAELMREGE